MTEQRLCELENQAVTGGNSLVYIMMLVPVLVTIVVPLTLCIAIYACIEHAVWRLIYGRVERRLDPEKVRAIHFVIVQIFGEEQYQELFRTLPPFRQP